MVDLFGSIPLDNHPAKAKLRPFRHLSGIEKIRFTESHLEVEGQHWWMLHQDQEPAVFEDDKIVVLLHGQCYPVLNHKEGTAKRKLFPRQIADRYRQSGKTMMHDLKGSFVVVVIDRVQKRLEVFTDPLNLRTVYYTSRDRNLLISTSLTAIANFLTEGGASVETDRRAILDLYLFDFTLDDHTFLQNVRELGPGAQLTLFNGDIKVSTWFDPFQYFRLGGKLLNRRDGALLVRNTLADNIRLYNEGPEHTSVALTGGFDSRSIVALLQDPMTAFTFFSYGTRQSWDVKIPQVIANRLGLNYEPIYLDEVYESSFSEYSRMAVLLSDGAAEFSHANIPYVYANFLRDKRSILTGLFGSELIKTPSSRGLFLDTNTITLLTSKDPVAAMRSIFHQMDAGGSGLPFTDAQTREEVIEMVRTHPYINNDLPVNEKFFYYMLMVGVRKYFRKETKIQRYWKSNLHPFFDIEFVAKLLETPFPWVYHFSRKKSLLRNISIHKLYGSIIQENPALSDIVSTHGYRPRRLTDSLGLPMLAIEFFLNKKTISKATTLNFQQSLALREVNDNKAAAFHDASPGVGNFFSADAVSVKNRIKIASLQCWLKSIGLSL